MAFKVMYDKVTERVRDWSGVREFVGLVKQDVLLQVGFTCSVGCAPNKSASLQMRPCSHYIDRKMIKRLLEIRSTRSLKRFITDFAGNDTSSRPSR